MRDIGRFGAPKLGGNDERSLYKCPISQLFEPKFDSIEE